VIVPSPLLFVDELTRNSDAIIFFSYLWFCWPGNIKWI